MNTVALETNRRPVRQEVVYRKEYHGRMKVVDHYEYFDDRPAPEPTDPEELAAAVADLLTREQRPAPGSADAWCRTVEELPELTPGIEDAKYVLVTVPGKVHEAKALRKSAENLRKRAAQAREELAAIKAQLGEQSYQAALHSPGKVGSLYSAVKAAEVYDSPLSKKIKKADEIEAEYWPALPADYEAYREAFIAAAKAEYERLAADPVRCATIERDRIQAELAELARAIDPKVIRYYDTKAELAKAEAALTKARKAAKE